MEDADNPLANYKLKDQRKIKRLIARNDLDELKRLSQHCIKNACYAIRFGQNNDLGVHNCCPMEMLHALLLGIFKYAKDCFFDQTGKQSKTLTTILAYCQRYGELLSRQSQRDLPKTRFPNGLNCGRITGKEYRGIVLCMAAALRSDVVRDILRKEKSNWREEGVIDDWQWLLDTLLQMEAWLKSDKLKISHVKRAQRKLRYVMYVT